MGPVMVGPSSSHTAGTARLGRVAREILDEDPVEVHFHLHPPLAATYRGHGSDFALIGGAIGLNVDDPRIPEAIRIAEQMGVTIEFGEEDLGEVHPNTVRIEIQRCRARRRDRRLLDRRRRDRGLQDQRLPDALQRRLADAAALLSRSPGHDRRGRQHHRRRRDQYRLALLFAESSAAKTPSCRSTSTRHSPPMRLRNYADWRMLRMHGTWTESLSVVVGCPLSVVRDAAWRDENEKPDNRELTNHDRIIQTPRRAGQRQRPRRCFSRLGRAGARHSGGADSGSAPAPSRGDARLHRARQGRR